MRINKYIASAGLASRRGADELIKNGNVRVNGAVLTEPGYDVQEGDVVLVNGRPVESSEKLVYYALNKPAGFITTASEEQGRPTVLDLMTDVTVRVFPVGRLDGASTGLLIMTNDGSLSYHISHPKNKVWKSYKVLIDGAISLDKIEELKNGVDIGGYTTKPAEVELKKQTKGTSLLEIKISEGKNRQIRRMIKAVGFNVIELQRTAIGKVQLGRLKEGGYRKLSKEEIEYLKNC
ncbi:MAG: rRNA pseudouridine synthase [Firmicutes bacterium]|nr:rRNA pseudouridine synthase [Bacillota bacterium]